MIRFTIALLLHGVDLLVHLLTALAREVSIICERSGELWQLNQWLGESGVPQEKQVLAWYVVGAMR